MSPFRVGETLIAGRYRLARFIAQGGMGEVYEAFDEELQQRIAMKIVRRDVSASPVAQERFKREISLARRVTHPNVSRIFEFGRHQDADGAVTFLTMELLQGVTLQERIRVGGSIPPAQALTIVEQVCAGLEAAHAAGVVHRDLKSSNVILARGQDGGLRVVITDFGLARALTGDDAATTTLTATDLMVGTPAYMSPEQAQGFELTPRSDLYSLGIVLYEMLTGRFPHAGMTPMAILINRLKEPPPSPIAVMPALDPRWDAVVRRCLEVKPERRFASASDVVRALRGEEVPPPPPASDEMTPTTEIPHGPRTRRRALAGLAALLVLGLVSALPILLRTGGTAMRGNARRSAAVLGFKNLSGRQESAWLSTALSEMLTAELAAGEQIRTVPGETVARARVELDLPETDALEPATLATLRSVLGSDVVVLGSFFVGSADPSAPLRVDLRMQDAVGQRADVVISETGTPEQVLVLIASLGKKLRSGLGVEEASPAQSERARAAFPESAEARRLYAEGLSRLRSFDLVDALALLEKAAKEAPGNPRIRSALAACYVELGDDARARETAQTALETSSSLPREERLLIEGQLAEAKKEWTKAIDDYRALFRFFPDDVEHALRLAEAQTRSGKAKDALETLREAAKLGPDPRVSLATGIVQLSLAQYKAALVSARNCGTASTRSGARLLVAKARMLEAAALLRLGDYRESARAGEEARALFAATGDRNDEALALNRIATIDFEMGDYEHARKGFELARDRWSAAGSRKGVATALENLADVYERTGELSKAAPLFEEALSSFRELGAETEVAIAEVNIAQVAYRRGDLRSSLLHGRQAVATSRAASYPYGLVPALYTLAQTEASAGRLTEARAAVEEALVTGDEIGDQRALGFALQTAAKIDQSLGDLPGARGSLEKALAIRRTLHDRAGEAESLIALGELCRDEGRAAAGIELLRKGVARARELGRSDTELLAVAGLVRAALAAGDAREAETAAARGAALAERSEDIPARLALEVAHSELALARKDLVSARALLAGAREQARRTELALLEGELRLLQARLQRASGRSEEASRLLGDLAREADERGWRLLARKARSGS